MQVVIGKGHVVRGHKRISLCRQAATIVSDSEDEREVPASQAASSRFGSAESDLSEMGIQPSTAVISAAAAAAAGNEIPSKLSLLFPLHTMLHLCHCQLSVCWLFDLLIFWIGVLLPCIDSPKIRRESYRAVPFPAVRFV